VRVSGPIVSAGVAMAEYFARPMNIESAHGTGGARGTKNPRMVSRSSSADVTNLARQSRCGVRGARERPVRRPIQASPGIRTNRFLRPCVRGDPRYASVARSVWRFRRRVQSTRRRVAKAGKQRRVVCVRALCLPFLRRLPGAYADSALRSMRLSGSNQWG
jgi:hypothetical protein